MTRKLGKSRYAWVIGAIVLVVAVALAGRDGRRVSGRGDLTPYPTDTPEIRGEKLHAAVDDFYAALPLNYEPRTSTKLYADMSEIVGKYISVGASFNDAESIVGYAGFSITGPRHENHWGMRRGDTLDVTREYVTDASLKQCTLWPLECMRASIVLKAEKPADFGAVGRVDGYIYKKTWWDQFFVGF